ncbi:MAG: 50S ribosomal protein L21 [Candidatus Levybacteria bacterium GW2011_GWA2_40_8]|nr:MAG: 50S ribosomal protein L21 [Candidatus Levybacteria bacterium GW2011_GWA2_40_8]
MKFAVIKASGAQYLVSEKETISLDNLSKEKGDEVVFKDVLLLSDSREVLIGKPYVLNCKVVGKIVENVKGKKIKTFQDSLKPKDLDLSFMESTKCIPET